MQNLLHEGALTLALSKKLDVSIVDALVTSGMLWAKLGDGLVGHERGQHLQQVWVMIRGGMRPNFMGPSRAWDRVSTDPEPAQISLERASSFSEN